MKRRKRLGIGGVFAFFAAIMLALVIAPGAAKADPVPFKGDSLTINKLLPGDKVTIYEVVETDIDLTTNNVTHKFTADFAEGWTISDWEALAKAEHQDVDAIAKASNNFALFVNDPAKADSLPNKTQTVASDGHSVTFDGENSPDSGQYLVVVKNDADSTRAFQNTVVSVMPKANEAGEFIPQETSADLKFTDMTSAGVKKFISDKSTELGGDSLESIDSTGTAYFTIKSTVAKYSDPENNRIFKFVDTMSAGFKYNKDLVIKTDSSDPAQLVEGSDYTVTDSTDEETHVTTITVALTASALHTYGGIPISITYSSKVVAQADDAVHSAKYSAAETNDVVLTFSRRSVGLNARAADETSDVATSEYKVYLTVWGITFTKVSSTDSTPLKNAEFAIYRADSADHTVIAKGSTDSEGVVIIEGVLTPNVNYFLSETKAPAGFTPIADLGFSIDKDANPSVDHKGQLVAIGDDGKIADTPSGFATDLPITGGAGTIALTAVGVCLIAGAAVIIGRSRKNHQ